MDVTVLPLAGNEADRPYLHLFGGPFVTVGGDRTDLPEGCKRLIALVAMRRLRIDRTVAAGVLWPAVSDRRAAGNLRSVLWRMRSTGVCLVDADSNSVALRPDVAVDAHIAGDWALRLIEGQVRASDLTLMPWCDEALDLLPGWYDDWAVHERERLRQRVLHALEDLSRHLSAAGRFAEAVEAALIAVGADPLRESAQRALIQAHMAEGNLVAAFRTYDAYRTLIHSELGAAPSPLMAALIGRTPPRG